MKLCGRSEISTRTDEIISIYVDDHLTRGTKVADENLSILNFPIYANKIKGVKTENFN